MYDLLGGGFHRYSVDDRWLVPHFEKMLYDNALLASAYLHGWLVTGDERYREVARATVEYMLRELLLPEGGFASAQDADTDGVEGLTFTWTEEEGAPAELLEPFEHGRSIIRGERRPGDARPALRAAGAAAEAAARRQGDRVLERARARGARGGRPAARAAGLGRGGARPRRVPARPALRRGRPAAPQPARRADERRRATSTTTRTSRTGCSSSTSRPASCAGSRRRTGSRGWRSSSSPTRSTAASSSRPRTASAWSRGRRSSTTIRSRPATRCSRTCCCGSRGSTATTSSSGAAWRCSGSCGRRSSGRPSAFGWALVRARPAPEPAARARDRRPGRLGRRAGGARALAAEHRRRDRAVPSRRAAARRQGARRRQAGRVRLRAVRLPGARHRSGRAVSAAAPNFPGRTLSKFTRRSNLAHQRASFRQPRGVFMRRVSLAGLALVGALLLAIPSAFAQVRSSTAADPGITASTITIGGTFPLTGPVVELCADPGRDEGVLQLHQRAHAARTGSAASTAARSSSKYYDDGYNPVNSVQLTAEARRGGQGLRGRRLARHRGEPGGPARTSTRRRSRTSSSRPARATSARTTRSTRGRSAGSRTTSRKAGSTARTSTKNHPNAKIAILYQNDSYGKDYLERLQVGARHREGEEPDRRRGGRRGDGRGPPQSQLVRLRATGADTLMIFVTTTPTIQTYAIIRALGWKPANIYVNSVSATDTFMSDGGRAPRAPPRSTARSAPAT